MFKNSESPIIKTEKESVWKKLRNKLPDPKLVMAAVMLGASPASFGQRAEQEFSNQRISKDNPRDFMEQIESAKPTGDLYFRFNEKNDDGEVVFNPWSVIAPAQIELGYQAPEVNTVTLDLPYKYSRLFNTAEIVDPHDKDKTRQYIDSCLKAELAQSIYFLDFSNNSREVYNAYHDAHGDNLLEKFSGNEVEAIKITGFTSPEGPETKGSSSLEPGNIDQENIALGKKRAADIDPVLREELKKFGIETDKIASVNSEELQFSDQEMAHLDLLAKQNGITGVNQLDRIFMLIRAYNDGTLTDRASLEDLDKIVGSKRMVEVTITLKTDEERRVVVPLPLTLLLLLTVPYLIIRKNRQVEDDNFFRRSYAKGAREIFSEKEVDNNTEKLREIDQVKFAEWSKQADQETSVADREVMKKRMFVDEIVRYLDDKRSINLGLDYRTEIKNIATQADDYKGRAEELEVAVSLRMLQVWQDYDRLVRGQFLGLPALPENILDYRQDPKKIAWAKIAARQLIEAAEILKNNKSNFNDEMNRKAEELSRLNQSGS